MGKALDNSTAKTMPDPRPSDLKHGLPDVARQRQLLANLGCSDGNIDDASTAAMLRNASVLFSETLGADRYLTVVTGTRKGMIDLELGPRESTSVENAVVKRQVELTAVPSGLRRALTRNESVIVAEWNGSLGELGIANAVFCPVHDDTGVLGALGIVSREKRGFAVAEVLFGESLAQIVSASHVGRSIRRALKESRTSHTTLLNTVNAIVLRLDEKGIMESINRAGAELTGFEKEELAERSIWSVLVVPEEIGMVKAAFARIANGEMELSFESSILTKQANRRRVAWSFSVMPPSTLNGKTTLLGTGLDITEKEETLDQLKRAKKEAEDAQRQLANLRKEMDAKKTDRRKSAARPNDRKSFSERAERRSVSRRLYPYRQLIAPIVGGRMPNRNAFYEVSCRNIGAKGLAFLSKDPPRYKQLVVALGASTSFTFLAAEVVHSTPTEINGRTQFLVGCRYSSRVEL